MIELYAKGTTNFAKNGIRIHPQEAEVTYTESGQWDMEMTMPAEGDFTDFDYGQILRVSVPWQHIDEITLGAVSYWTVTSAEDANLYSEAPKQVSVSYAAWTSLRSYSAGDKRSYDKKNWQATTGHGGRNTPPPDGGLWRQIASTTTTAGTVIRTLTPGTIIMKVGDFNDEYMEAATTDGYQGYIKIADCTDSGETGVRKIPERTIETQLFVVTEVRKNQAKQTITVSAEHISYQLGRTMLGECNVVNVTPATALMFIRGAMKEEYAGNFYTNISGTDYTVTGDWSWANAQTALLDPKNGLIEATNAQLIRDNLDVIVLAEDEETDPAYTVRFGANMKDVTWTGNVDKLVTRIYPIAKTEDNRTLTLPEEYIDSPRSVPFVRPETLNSGLKVGAKEESSDGTETELTEEEIYNRLRTMATERFTIDKVDRAEVGLELDWLHMPDTEEYKQYSELKNVAPGEYVLVYSAPLGISERIRLTGYVWDPLNETYKSGKFGTLKVQPTVAGYNIASGAVKSTHIASNSIGSSHIMANSITAKEIAAGSITAEKIASKQISTEHLAANSITADEITANSITAEKIAANSITAEKIAANAITAEKIAAGSITADKIAAGVITADKIAAHTITSDLIAAHTITSDEIAAHTITSDEIAALAITANVIAADAITADKIAANAVTANAIDAGAITTEKLDAGAVTAQKIAASAITTDKIAAGAVTADKLEAGAITADKISTTDLTAINAKLGTADIARAEIASADIDYAHIKDLTAGTAIFDTAITETGIADRLYINRLLITYGQMVEATIGDLVIGASDGNFYHVDVEWDEDEVPTLVPTMVTAPTAEEIEAGHTSTGKTIIGNIGTFAELSSEDFYAINSIIDRITARRIDVDELWARQAFINQLMVQDISSNTYIRSTIGNWQSQSTISQTLEGLETRISSLGYGTIYYSVTEPQAEELVQGDIWVQPLEDNVWNDYTTQEWQDILDMDDWGAVMGAYKVYTWTGQHWKTLFDSMVNTEMWTTIQQNSAAIALKASQADLNLLSGEVSEFGATLEIQSQEISAAVSAVNTKASTYVMWADPTTVYTVTLGDIWIKTKDDFGSWLQAQTTTWQKLKSSYKWKDALGDETYVWDGSKWVMTADRATEIYQETLINQTATQISLVAQTTAQLQNATVEMRSELAVANDRISAEVSRATTADNAFTQKTQFLMTSGRISLEAFTDGVSGTAMGVLTKAGISVDGTGKIQLSSLAQDVQAGVNKAASITMSNGKIVISALETNAQNAINKAANITVDGSGKIELSALSTGVQGTINKAAGITVDSSGKILISALESNAVSAIDKATSISMSNGKILISALESNAVSAINKAASITMSNGKIVISALETNAQNAINKAASITMNNGKIVISALETNAQNAINKAASINVNSSGKILISALETNAQNAIDKAAGITVDGSTGKILLSAAKFDSLGSSTSNVYITPTQVKIQSNSFVVDSTNFSLTKTGVMTANSGSLGGWSFDSTRLESGSGSGYVRLNSKTTDTYAIICGSETAASAPFRVKRDGSVSLTKLLIIGEDNTETEVNLRTSGLWKLAYSTVKSSTSNSITLSNGTTINFIKAADLRVVQDPVPASAATTNIPIKIYTGQGDYYKSDTLDVTGYHDLVRGSVSITNVSGGVYSTAAHTGMVYVTLSNGVTTAQAVSFTQY